MKDKKIIVLALLSFGSLAFGQDDLINKLKNNQSQNPNFQFSIIQEIDNTPVKNQGSSGTCWSYSGILLWSPK